MPTRAGTTALTILVACGPVIAEGDQDRASTTAAASSDSPTGSGSPTGTSTQPTSGSSRLDVGSGGDRGLAAFYTDTADGVMLSITIHAGATCGDTMPWPCAAMVDWNLEILLPPPVELGNHSFATLEGFVWLCSGGVGPIESIDGTLVIEAVGATIDGALVEVDYFFTEAPVNTKFSAIACP